MTKMTSLIKNIGKLQVCNLRVMINKQMMKMMNSQIRSSNKILIMHKCMQQHRHWNYIVMKSMITKFNSWKEVYNQIQAHNKTLSSNKINLQTWLLAALIKVLHRQARMNTP